jgi:hypothetical protein
MPGVDEEGVGILLWGMMRVGGGELSVSFVIV